MTHRELPNSATVLASIRSGGHYRVSIEPARYDSERIASLTELQRLIADCSVRLRGWDYPHLSERDGENGRGQNYIDSWVMWRNYHEYWRMFQSVQFVHLFKFHESEPSYAEKIRTNLHGIVEGVGDISGFLDITSSIWTMTEIFEFGARLAQTSALLDGLSIDVQLREVANRVLGFSEWERDVHRLYRARENQLTYRRAYSQEEIVSRARSLAVDASAFLFERFGANFERAVLEDIQAALYRVRG